MRHLKSWFLVHKAIEARNHAIRSIDFRKFDLSNLPMDIVGSPNAVEDYTSKLCVYFNDTDPSIYHQYLISTKVKLASNLLLYKIVMLRYEDMFRHLKSLYDEKESRSGAGFYFQLIGRIALTERPSFVVRDLNLYKDLPRSRKHESLFTMRLELGTVAPPEHDLLSRVMDLAHSTFQLTQFPSTDGEADQPQSIDDIIAACDAEVHSTDAVRSRWLYYTSSNFANIDAFDGKNRGYQFTVSSTHKMRTAQMIPFLDAVGATRENPFHLFLAVPDYIFPSVTTTQTLEGTKKNPLTDAIRADIDARVRQYIIRIPSVLRPQ